MSEIVELSSLDLRYEGHRLRDDAHAPERYSQEMEDHFSITRIEPGKLWLEPFVSGDWEIGPVPVPREVSDLCKVGWDISGRAVKTPKGWRLVEAWNVSP